MLRLEQDLVLAIEPECYRRWVNEATAHLSDAALLEKLHSPEAASKLIPQRKMSGAVAVVNLSGFITQKPSMLSMLFGGTSTEGLVEMVRAAMADPEVVAVILNVDSPGGSVHGVPEAAAAIRALRGQKPIIAIANPLAASAAYWMAAQADEIVMAPSAIAGSLGVKVAHVDESEALKQAGLSVTEITYGRRKTEESSIGPLSEEARASIQSRIDYFGKLFEADVAKGRGVSVATVRSNFGEGSVMTADAAKSSGLVDRVATLEQVINGLASGQRPKVRAEAEPLPIVASADPVTDEYDPAELAAIATLAGILLDPSDQP
jgi:signal peptide peptidase SppA